MGQDFILNSSCHRIIKDFDFCGSDQNDLKMVKIIHVRSLDTLKPEISFPKVIQKETEEDEKETCMSSFCGRTSLHGWKYLRSEAGLFPKIVWLLAITSAVALSARFTFVNVEEFSSASTRSSIQSTTASLQDIIFPSVYVCNINQVRCMLLEKGSQGQDSSR